MKYRCDICGDKEIDTQDPVCGPLPQRLRIDCTEFTHLMLNDKHICASCCEKYAGVISFKDLDDQGKQFYVKHIEQLLEEKFTK